MVQLLYFFGLRFTFNMIFHFNHLTVFFLYLFRLDEKLEKCIFVHTSAGSFFSYLERESGSGRPNKCDNTLTGCFFYFLGGCEHS